MWLVDYHTSILSQHLCLLFELTEHVSARSTVDVDRSELDEVRELAENGASYLHVELQGRRIRMNRDKCHARTLGVHVEAVRDQLRLTSVDEFHEFVYSGPDFLELALSDVRTGRM